MGAATVVPGQASIGVDSGGTFTDTVVVLPSGHVVVGKALSTPHRVEVGVMDSLRSAATAAGLDLGELLALTAVITHGTTVGLNALLTRRGARVGMITTAGFESTLSLARANKIHGLDEVDAVRPVRWRKPDPLLRRRDVVGVPERLDRHGNVVVPLDEAAARVAIRRLVETGVEAIAVGLLWSCSEPRHERRIAELVAEETPGMPVSLSSTVAPVVGEYERFATTVMDAAITPVVSAYLGRLEALLAGAGFRGNLMVLRTGGGGEPVARTREAPVNSLRSGPVAGLVASAAVGAALGHDKVLATDVGGTSFDIGLVVGRRPERSARPLVDRHPLAVPAIEVVSIGTGGGSIAWLDTGLGALRVGPQSAGADPGPACYGRGGVEPTLTDAAAVLGYVDRLGAKLRLDVDAARDAIGTRIAEPLGRSVEDAAAGIVRVATDQMKDLIRRGTIQRGFDPSAFALFAYGGAGPQYAAWYSAGLRLTDVIVPRFAAEFSAFGAATSDVVVNAERDVVPVELGDCGRTLDEAFASLDAEVEHEVGGDAAALERRLGGRFARRRTVSLRFLRQRRRVDLPVDTWSGPDLEVLAGEFRRRYEEVTGHGTAPVHSTIEVVAARVTLTLERSASLGAELTDKPAEPAGRRHAWFDGRRVGCPVYAWDSLGRDQRILGPAFVESEQSTLVVPPGTAAVMDASAHLHLDLGAADG